MKTSNKIRSVSSQNLRAHKNPHSQSAETRHFEKEAPVSWGSSLSQILISDYALPFTRLVESKLIELQSRV